MLEVAGLVLPLFALVLFGWLAGRWRPLPVEGLAWLNFFVVYVALPALFFRLLSRTPTDEFANGAFLARTTLATLLAFALCFAIARLFRRGDTRAATIQGFAGAYGNIGYMGPPLAIAAFGPEAGVPVALVICLDNALHFTLAPLLMTIGRRRSGEGDGESGAACGEDGAADDAASAAPRRTAKAAPNSAANAAASGPPNPSAGAPGESLPALLGGVVRSIVTHPFILATLAGIAAAALGWRPPGPIDTLLASLSNAAAPCALFAMGVTAALRPLRRVPPELLWLVPIKLVVHPALLYALLAPLADVDPTWLHAAVLLAALPSATNVFVIAQQYGVWEERASSVVVLSTACSIVTLTLYLYLVRSGML